MVKSFQSDGFSAGRDIFSVLCSSFKCWQDLRVLSLRWSYFPVSVLKYKPRRQQSVGKHLGITLWAVPWRIQFVRMIPEQRLSSRWLTIVHNHSAPKITVLWFNVLQSLGPNPFLVEVPCDCRVDQDYLSALSSIAYGPIMHWAAKIWSHLKCRRCSGAARPSKSEMSATLMTYKTDNQ